MAGQFAIQRILVPLDWSPLSEQAIPYAAALAGRDAEIVFLHVLSDPEPERDLLGRVKETAAEVGADARADAVGELNAIAGRWSDVLGAAPKVEVATGEPGEEILRVARALACDLIVSSSRGQGGLGRLIFGSVADRIAREAAVPTLIVRPEDKPAANAGVAFGRVIVADDGSELADEALPVAAAVAARLGVGVHLVRAVEPLPLTPGVTPMQPAYPIVESADMLAEIEDEAKASLAEAAGMLRDLGAPVTSEVVTGPAVSALAGVARAGDLIVLTSHGRSGFQRLLLGSVAEGLVRDGPAPVLLVPSSTRLAATADDSAGG